MYPLAQKETYLWMLCVWIWKTHMYVTHQPLKNKTVRPSLEEEEDYRSILRII